jgi:hypothetical protein
MTQLDFGPGTFDAVAAFYSITHVPHEEHASLFLAIRSWLRPGGLFLAALGARSSDGAVENDWLGVPMYFSHFDSETNIQLLAEAGFRILEANEETANEDGLPATFLWVLAVRP